MEQSFLVKKCDEHHFDLGLEHSDLLWSWWSWRLPLETLPFRLGIVLKNPCFISSNDLAKKLRLFINCLQDVSANIHSMLLVVIAQQFWHHFRVHNLNTFRILRLSVKMVLTVSLFIPNSYASILTVNRRSLRTRVLTLSMLCAVVDVEGRPGFGSSSTSSRPLLKRLCYSKTLARDIQSAP